MTPSFDEFALLRNQMVEEQLARRGIENESVLSVMRRIPRERFVPPSLESQAYLDRALGTELGQTISQPYIVAYMTEQLDVHAQHRVLEIGTGTGYQTAILARLASRVFTVERLPTLSESAEVRVSELGITNVEYRCSDGTAGWPTAAPFDRILVAAAAPVIPAALVEQLADRGRLILPVGDADSQRLVLVEKDGSKTIERSLIGVRFVKLIGEGAFES